MFEILQNKKEMMIHTCVCAGTTVPRHDLNIADFISEAGHGFFQFLRGGFAGHEELVAPWNAFGGAGLDVCQVDILLLLVEYKFI